MPDALRTMLASAHRHLLSKLEPAEVPVLANVFIRLQEIQRVADGSVVAAPRIAGDDAVRRAGGLTSSGRPRDVSPENPPGRSTNAPKVDATH